MDIKDVVTLAHAGFTADQIRAMLGADTAPTPAPTPAPPPAPTPAPTPTPDFSAMVEEMKKVTEELRKTALLNTSQPKEQNASDILASILDPSRKEV